MNFFRGFSLNTASTFLVFSLGFFNASLLAEQLGRKHYGALKVWTVCVMLGGLALGEWLNKGATFLVGRDRARDAAIDNSLLYTFALAGGLLLSAPLTLKFGAFLFPDLTLIQWSLGLGLIALTVLEKAELGILLGEERIKLYSLLPVIFIGAYLGGNLLLTHLGLINLEWTMAIWLAAMAMAILAGMGAFLRHGYRPSWGDRQVLRRMAVIGTRGEVALMLVFLLLKSDVFLVNFFLGQEGAGVYGVATNFTDMMQRVPNIASVILFAKVVRGQDSARLTLRVAQGTFLFSLAVAAGFVLFGRLLLALFFPQYPDAYIPLIWLLPGMLFSGFGAVCNAKLIGQGYPPVTLWAPAVALAMNVSLNLWLIPILGLRGAALSTSLSYSVWGSIVTTYYLRQVHLSWRELLHPPFFKSRITF